MSFVNNGAVDRPVFLTKNTNLGNCRPPASSPFEVYLSGRGERARKTKWIALLPHHRSAQLRNTIRRCLIVAAATLPDGPTTTEMRPLHCWPHWR